MKRKQLLAANGKAITEGVSQAASGSNTEDTAIIQDQDAALGHADAATEGPDETRFDPEGAVYGPGYIDEDAWEGPAGAPDGEPPRSVVLDVASGEEACAPTLAPLLALAVTRALVLGPRH